ncbi:Fcf2 pre-rRNA processing-domain-containing protein [Rhodocollybia butyracea]|uniref:Fcf2 pre-rRNA processing-domain-containing protein n=1 Tax=Rhodocollybia butyracea TaxID=206335 RepID=A0A9P5UGK5_9AGAR|nr:Fcf2 pre-rRNA processing-domain-containing protein [Rhodocollybia butyracea]
MSELNDKGKEKDNDLTENLNVSSSSSDSDTDDSSSSSASSDSEDDDPITQEYLDSLLEKARQNVTEQDQLNGDDVLVLENSSQPPLPSLNPGKLPPSYFTYEKEGSILSRDPDAESAVKASRSIPMPEFHHDKILTQKQKKELKNKTTGPDWFDLPAPAEADLPRLYREVEALRLRNQLDPKRFYRKEEGEGKGIKGLPKHFAIGKIVTTNTPFGEPSGENLTRAERKRTLVDELVDDAEMKRYAKRKFEDLQKVKGAKGRNTLNAKKRKPKW